MAQLPAGFVLDDGPAPTAAGPVYGAPPKPDKPDAPKTRYRTLTPEEAAAQGLPAGRPYQVSSEGKIEALPESKKPLPNPDRLPQVRSALENIKRLRELSRESLAVGGMSGRVGAVPLVGGWLGQNRKDVEGSLEMVEGDLIQQQIAALSAASGGGGVASLANSETEARRMAASIANLSPDQSLEEFSRGLDRAEAYYKRQLEQLGGTPEPTRSASQLGAAVGGMIAEDEGLTGSVSDDTPSPFDPRPAPPPPTAPTSPGGGWLGALGDATVNTAAGIGQGIVALPDALADMGTGVQRVVAKVGGNALGYGLNALGATSAGQSVLSATERNDQLMGNAPNLTGMIERIAPTPQDGAGQAVRFASQLAGGARSPFNKLLPTPAPQVRLPTAGAAPNALRPTVDEARQAGVRVMTSDVKPPRTFVGKTAQSIGERIPFAGTGGGRQAQQAERVEAVKDLARDLGADVAADASTDVLDDFVKTRGAQVSKLTAQKNAVINRIEGPVPVPNAIQAIDDGIAKLRGVNADEYQPVIAKLERFKATLSSGKALNEVEGNRKLLGEMFADPSLASIKGEGQKVVNAIYGPLRQDMGDFIKQNGGPAALNRWKTANDQLAAMAGELKVSAFRSVLKSADATPENISKLLFSQRPSDVSRLMGNLSSEGQAKARAAVLHRALEKSGGLDDLSPDMFAKQIRGLGRTAGVIFPEHELARVEALTRVLKITQRAATASVAPPTGVQNSIPVIGVGLGSLFGVAALPVAAGIGVLARAYESAPVRNALIRLAHTKPGSKQEATLLPRAMSAVNAAIIQFRPRVEQGLAQSPVRAAAHEDEQNGRRVPPQ